MRRRQPAGKVLRAVRANAGLTAAYRRKMVALVDEMATSYRHWLVAQYRAKPPAMAMDASAAKELQRALQGLGSRWLDRFDEAAPRLARWFLRSVSARSERALMQILRDAGMTVKFKMTPSMRDVVDATVAENVSLIRSIPLQYHQQVEGLVMRSVTAGRDLEQLNRDLLARYKITEKRAALISLDQNNKATSALMKARQTEMGIEQGVWLHSHAGKEPRPTHLANHGNVFSIQEGWFDPDPKVRERIWPGQLIRCRCTWKPIVPGFS